MSEKQENVPARDAEVAPSETPQEEQKESSVGPKDAKSSSGSRRRIVRIAATACLVILLAFAAYHLGKAVFKPDFRQTAGKASIETESSLPSSQEEGLGENEKDTTKEEVHEELAVQHGKTFEATDDSQTQASQDMAEERLTVVHNYPFARVEKISHEKKKKGTSWNVLNTALTKYYNNQNQSSLELLSTLKAPEIEDSALCLESGWLYYELGRSAKARDFWLRGLQLSPNDKELSSAISQTQHQEEGRM